MAAHVTSEVLSRKDAAAAIKIEQGIGIQVLPFASEPQGVASHYPTEGVTDLVPFELGALRDTEVGAVL